MNIACFVKPKDTFINQTNGKILNKCRNIGFMQDHFDIVRYVALKKVYLIVEPLPLIKFGRKTKQT
jgi:hypothetical protein